MGLSAAQLGGSNLELTVCQALPATDSLGPAVDYRRVSFSGQLHRPCPGASSQVGFQPYTLTLSSLRVVRPQVPIPAAVATNVSWPLPCTNAVVLLQEAYPGSLPCVIAPLGLGQARNFIVQSQDDFAQIYAASYTRCGLPLPTIDFSRYTLLIGERRTSQPAPVLGQRVIGCPDGTYTYSVELGKGMVAALDFASYGVLVPKIPATASVDFDVRITP